MQVLPVDLIALVGTILGISIVLIPVIGLTARFAFKPVVEALAKVFEGRDTNEAMRMLERRVELQDHELAALHATVRNLVEAQDFERRLAAPTASEREPTETDPTAS